MSDYNAPTCCPGCGAPLGVADHECTYCLRPLRLNLGHLANNHSNAFRVIDQITQESLSIAQEKVRCVAVYGYQSVRPRNMAAFRVSW